MLETEHDATVYSAGHELLQRVRAGERAELERVATEQAERTIFITGGAFTTASRTFLERVPNARLEKPFGTTKVRA